MDARIVNHNGTPTIFLDGKPIFYGLMWGSGPTPQKYALKECARYYGEAGVHFYTFDVGAGGSPPEWIGPNNLNDTHYDFSTVVQRFQHVIDADPQAMFHLRIHLEMPEWWQKLYPEECELLSNGQRMCQSYASTLWRQQAKDFLPAYIAFFLEAGLLDLVAYQAGTGSSGEWVKGPGAMGLTCGDYSLPMKKHFQAWVRDRYQKDETALRQAWADPAITFETVQAPSPDAQFRTARYTFRDPQKEQAVIDYYLCLAELSPPSSPVRTKGRHRTI